jgi:8-oxo-dGTP pyrophosphatase MutT (NUDIX family)
MMMDRWVHGGVPSDPSSVDRACYGEAWLVVARWPPVSGQNDRVHTDPQRNDGAPGAPEVRMLTTSVVYADQWVTFRRDETERSDGFRGTYAFVDKRNFALIIPAENGGFHLVEEYRYPLGRRGWSFPQGGFPHDESGTTEELARLELAQETGLRAARLTRLGTVAAGHGMTNQYGEYFLATDLTPGPSDLEPEELDLKHEWVTRAEFEAMTSDRRIVDDSTLAAYALLLLAERRGDIDLS